MSTNEKPTTRPTLGLGGLTINAMALIAPGAFLWLTFFIQSSYGAPMAAQGMWFGIFAALLLCLATAIAYAELSKLYPGAGSSYFFAEQAFLSKTKAYRFARIAKFMVGWASHLYYWVYPGLMVGVTALVVGYMVGQIWPDSFNAAIPSPLFMIVFCPLFAFEHGDQCHPDYGACRLLGYRRRVSVEPSARIGGNNARSERSTDHQGHRHRQGWKTT